MSSRGTLSKRTSCPDPRLQLQRSKPGFFRDVLEEAGFISIVIRDYSENIEPALWLFYILAVVPFVLVRLFRLKSISSTLLRGLGVSLGKRLALCCHFCDKPGWGDRL